jgi:TetR/AcrR family transcriptional regulator
MSTPAKRTGPRAGSTSEPAAAPLRSAAVRGRRNGVLGMGSQRELREEVVLECAAGWFHKHGFHGASLSDIAGELGITKAALYHYAKNKEELLYKLHARSLAAARGARDRAVRDGADGLDRLYRLVYNVVLIMTGSVTETFILLEPGTLDAKHSKEILARRDWLEHDMRDLLRKGIADGSVVPCDPKLVTFMIVGAQNWIGTWFRSSSTWTGEQIATGYASMIARMLSAGRVAGTESMSSTKRVVDVPVDIAACAAAPGLVDRTRALPAGTSRLARRPAQKRAR